MKTQVGSSTAKSVYCALATYVDSEGQCYPSIQTLSSDTELHRATVIRAINYLVQHGFVERMSNYCAASTRYQLTIWKGELMSNDSRTVRHEVISNIINIDTYISYSRRERLPYEIQEFLEFWQVYPRRKAKGQSRQAFVRACEKEKASVIIEAARLFAKSVRHVEKQYIPYASTWLNGERWEDDLDEIETNSDKLNSILNIDVAAELDNVVNIRKIGKK